MLTFDERMTIAEAASVDIYNKYSKLPLHSELTAVSDEIFDQIDDLQDRVVILRNTIALIEQIIATAEG